MRRTPFVAACIAALFFLPHALRAEFIVGFSGSANVQGEPGSNVVETYYATLSEDAGGTGVKGFSLGMSADDASITAITITGTDAGNFSQNCTNGFLHMELTHGAGNEGAVAAVVFGECSPPVLPAGTTHTVAALTVTIPVPEGTGQARLFYKGGLTGSGQPVAIVVIDADDTSKTPTFQDFTIGLQSSGGFIVGFSGSANVEGEAGSNVEETYYATLSEDAGGTGAQGFQFGVSAVDATITAITISGTQAERFLAESHFVKMELADPEKSGGNEGATAAVVLCMVGVCPGEGVLPAGTTHTVARLTVTIPIPQGTGRATLLYKDGLAGTDQQAVAIKVTKGGNSYVPVQRDFPIGVRSVTTAGAPDGLTAVEVTQSSVRLQWTDRSSDEDSFAIERRGPQDAEYMALKTVGMNVTECEDTGLCPEESYSYRVRAARGELFSAYSNEVSVETAAWPPGRLTVSKGYMTFGKKTEECGLYVKKGIFDPGDTVLENALVLEDVWLEVNEKMYFDPADPEREVMVKVNKKTGEVTSVTLRDAQKNKAVMNLKKCSMSLSLRSIPDPVSEEGFRRVTIEMHVDDFQGTVSPSGAMNTKNVNKIILGPATGSLSRIPGSCTES